MAKRRSFRKRVREAGEDIGIWKLAKWACTKAQNPNELPIIPRLNTYRRRTAETVRDKAEALKTRFFSRVELDLSDINKTAFQKESFPQNSIEVSRKAVGEEIEAIIKTRNPTEPQE